MSKQSDLIDAIQTKRVLLVKVGEESRARKIEPHILFRSLTMGGGMNLYAYELDNPNVLSSEPHWETFDTEKIAEVAFGEDHFTVRPDFEEHIEVEAASIDAKVIPDM